MDQLFSEYQAQQITDEEILDCLIIIANGMQAPIQEDPV
jgi:hypothetical protein